MSTLTPKPFKKFWNFLVLFSATVFWFVVCWDRGWWLVVAIVWDFLALDAGEEWFEEIDKSRAYRKDPTLYEYEELKKGVK